MAVNLSLNADQAALLMPILQQMCGGQSLQQDSLPSAPFANQLTPESSAASASVMVGRPAHSASLRPVSFNVNHMAASSQSGSECFSADD